MFLCRIFFSYLLFIFWSCNSPRKELVEGFFESGDESNDSNYTSTFSLHLLKDTILYWDADLLATAIADHNEFNSRGVGYAGIETDQYKRYKKLAETASDSTLVLLTDHLNPVVRVYAFYALKERNSESTISVFKKHSTDSESLKAFSGCIKTTTTVNKFMLNLLQPSEWNTSTTLSKKEFKKYLKAITGSDDEMQLSW